MERGAGNDGDLLHAGRLQAGHHVGRVGLRPAVGAARHHVQYAHAVPSTWGPMRPRVSGVLPRNALDRIPLPLTSKRSLAPPRRGVRGGVKTRSVAVLVPPPPTPPRVMSKTCLRHDGEGSTRGNVEHNVIRLAPYPQGCGAEAGAG